MPNVNRADPVERKKAYARGAVRGALLSGKLVRPQRCSRCEEPERFGKDGRSLLHAHHHRGYGFALDVEWLCVRCHFQLDLRPAGQNNGRAKLSEADVEEIRRRYEPGNARTYHKNCGRALAAEFNVDPTTISRIVRGQDWNRDTILNEGAEQ